MASKRDQTPVDVTWEDQRSICTFGRLHRHSQHVNDDIKKLMEDMEKLNDAADEIIIADDVMFVFGESFVRMDCDAVGERIETRKGQLTHELEVLKAEKAQLEAVMGKLKAQLYAKFGSQIYLESE